MHNGLAGKNAIITGARKGIGRAITEALASEGVNIWACSHSVDDAFLQDMAALSQRYGVWIDPVQFDLEKEEEIAESIKSIIKLKKPVDILVNNAGVSFAGTLSMQTMEKMLKTFQVNFFAPMRITQLVQRIMMRQKSGVIINIGSVSGCENYGGNIAYGSSKAAMIWATRELSKELAPFGIRVNSVSPGTTNTDMNSVRTEAQMDSVIARTAMRRPAETTEIANAVAFLASDEASYITGHNLVVDGGRLC